MDELILKELKEIKSLLQVIVSNQEQAGIQEINEYDDPIDIPLFVPGQPFLMNDRMISQLPAHLVQKGGHRHPLFNIVLPNSSQQEPHEEL